MRAGITNDVQIKLFLFPIYDAVHNFNVIVNGGIDYQVPLDLI